MCSSRNPPSSRIQLYCTAVHYEYICLFISAENHSWMPTSLIRIWRLKMETITLLTFIISQMHNIHDIHCISMPSRYVHMNVKNKTSVLQCFGWNKKRPLDQWAAKCNNALWTTTASLLQQLSSLIIGSGSSQPSSDGKYVIFFYCSMCYSAHIAIAYRISLV